MLLRAATLWALVGPRGGVCAFSCAAFAVSTLQFAQNQVRTAAMGAMLGLGALSLRRLDDLELFHQGVELSAGPPPVVLPVGATLSAVCLSSTSLWLMAKTKSAFFWWSFCAALAAAPSVLDTALHVKRERLVISQWLLLEFRELPKVLRSKRPEVLQSCQESFAHQWSSRGLRDEASIQELLSLVQTAGTEVVVSSLLTAVMPGTADHLAEPVTLILRPHTAEVIRNIIDHLDENSVVAALQTANIQLHGSRGDYRVRKSDCLELIENRLVGPAFDAAVTKAEEVSNDEASMKRALESCGGGFLLRLLPEGP